MTDHRNRRVVGAGVNHNQSFEVPWRGGRPLSINLDDPERGPRAGPGRGPSPGWRAAARADHADAPAPYQETTWRLCVEYGRLVRRHVPTRAERLRCYGCLMGWLLVDRSRARAQRLGALASGVGQRLQGAVRVARVSAAELRLRQR